MVDKRVLGIAIVSIILATLLILTIAGDISDEPIEILENEYPLTLPRGEATFTFSLIARRDIENIQVRFCSMSPRKTEITQITVAPTAGWAIDKTSLIDDQKDYQAGDTPDDILNNILKVNWFQNKTSDLGISPERFTPVIRIDNQEFQTEILDYSPIIEHLGGKQSTVGMPMLYAAMINETGGYLYLEGFSDMIMNPIRNIKMMTITQSENQTTYIPDDLVWEGSGREPLSTAPRGVVEFDSVKKDDTITIIFSMEPNVIPGPGLLQVIRVYVDGELFDEPKFNLILPPET
jgi:hypothetical protein